MTLNEKRQRRMEELRGFDDRFFLQDLRVAGMDEVGRGPLAGPVCTCCIMIPRDRIIPGVDDSKKLSEKRREELAPQLTDLAEYVRIGLTEPARIDEINILNATKEAMNFAAADCPADVLLVDAVTGLNVKTHIESVIHGDATSWMIAAASILAKVHRDRLMAQYDEMYPGYGFAKNKGYGTPEHIEALRRLGPCPIHRQSFIGGLL